MTSQDLEEDADQEFTNYRKKLITLDSELDTDNIHSLKYLCLDVIPASKLQKITQGTELFLLLEQAGSLGNGNFFFLAECLTKISRKDLSEILLDHHILKTSIENNGSKIPAHRSIWFVISEDLDSEEVSKCLYYYGDVPKSKRIDIKSGMDFLTFLEKMKKIGPDNMDYLQDVLKTIERHDLVKIIQKFTGQSSKGIPFRPSYRAPPPSAAGGQFDNEVESLKAREKERSPSDDEYEWKAKEKEKMSDDYTVSLPPESSDSLSYNKTSSLEIPMPMQIQLAYQICSEPEKIPEFGKTLRLSQNEIDKIITNNSTRSDMKVLDMIQIWSQKTQAEGEDKVNELIDALMESGFGDLSETLKTQLFRLNEGPVTELNVNPTPQDPLPELPVNGTRRFPNIVPSHTDAHQNHYISIGEARLMNPGEDDINLRQLNAEIAVVPPTPQIPLLDMYRMDRFPRGMCVIFNNENFTFDPRDRQAKTMNNRVGSSIDRDTLENTFTELGFTVYVHNDLKAVEMVQILTRYSLEDHSQFDCFVCVLLSHGTRDNIYGSNGVPVPIRTLADPLKNLSCPGLCGKPKLFFIQACQGQDKQHGRDIERDAVRVDDLDEDAPPSGEVIPNEQDFLIGMATIPGFVSYRSRTFGSWYIMKLCEAIKKFAKHWDILHILTYVNSEVGKANADVDGIRYKQSPAPLYTLRKLLVFQSPENPSV